MSTAFGGLAAAVPRATLERLVRSWLAEDCAWLDFGAAVVGSAEHSAVLYVKSPGLLAGCVFFDAVFAHLGCKVVWNDGWVDGAAITEDVLQPLGKVPLATVTGQVRYILQGERAALNALAECSGIGTVAARCTQLAKDAGWPGRLAGTRKTTPGFRLVQKFGMIAGGMDAHRMDLASMIMLKDNHIMAAGSIPDAVAMAKKLGGFAIKVDVECATAAEALEAAGAGADVVMLDNFEPAGFRSSAAIVKERYPHVIVEGSGGLSEKTIHSYFCENADVLSFSVNRYATPLDMSLKIRLQ